MSAVVSESGALPLSLNEVRDWLRLGPGDDDAAIVALIRAAASLCEAFTGQMVIVREVTEERWVEAGWMRLARQPVVAVLEVMRLSADGAPIIVPQGAWAEQQSEAGAVMVHIGAAPVGERVRIRYRAGMAEDGNGVPEALRHGLLRLVQHWHFAGQGDATLPAIVTALWTPWRRVSLGGRS